MPKLIKAVIFAGMLGIAPSVLLADEVEKQLSTAGRECSQHIEALRTKADTWRWVTVAIAAIGGMTASLTGLKAGLSKSNTRRRWGYAALVSGILAAVSPLLPKTDELRTQLVLSDQHRIVGLKVQRQLADLDPKLAFRSEAAKYAMARFTDCIAEEPPKEIPNLPTGIEKIEYNMD
jgi:hypothetical protein